MTAEERKGGGVEPTSLCVPNMAQCNVISFFKFNFSQYEIWVRGEGGGGGWSCGCQPF